MASGPARTRAQRSRRGTGSSGPGINIVYAAARVKARRARLIDRKEYMKMLRMDIDQLTRFVGDTVGRRDIDELASRFKGIDLLERASSRNLARNFRDVLSFVSGEARNSVEAYLRRFDIANIKTIIRGIVQGADPDITMANLIMAGELGEHRLRTMARAETIIEAVKALRGTGFHTVMNTIVDSLDDDVRDARDQAIRKRADLAHMENELYKAYYLDLQMSVSGMGRAGPILSTYYTAETDLVNARTLLRLRRERAPPDIMVRFIVPGGKVLEAETFRRLAYIETEDAFINSLKEKHFFKGVRELLDGYATREGIHRLLNALEKEHLLLAQRFGRVYPLTVLPIIDFIIQKEIEVRNIRAIARGRATGLSEQDVRDLLII